MFTSFYTTKMSANHKELKLRFMRMRNKKKKYSVFLAILLTVVLVAALSFAVMVAAITDAARQEQYRIEITGNGEVLELENPPFYENGELYLPLRELVEKLGVMESEYSELMWDNGKILLYMAETVPYHEDAIHTVHEIRYCYGMQIGDPVLTLNPKGSVPGERWNFGISKEMGIAPVLVRGVTYIPFSYVELMMNRAMQQHTVGFSIWDIAYDENVNREPDITEHNVNPIYERNRTDRVEPSVQVIIDFFDKFSQQDFEGMKEYCTENFIEKRFRDNSVFGIKRAEFSDGAILPSYEGKYERHVIVHFVAERQRKTKDPIKMVPDTVYVSMQKQPDGRWLIDKFGISEEELKNQ